MIIKRADLSRPLTFEEMDGNFTELNTKKVERKADVRATTSLLAPNELYNFYDITALSTDLAIDAPIGAFDDSDQILFKIKDDGIARALSWNPIYRGIGTDLPQQTRPSAVVYIGAIYNGLDDLWDIVAVAALN